MAPRCCGFAAIRCLLILLNSIYVGIAMFLVGLAIAARTVAYNFTNIQILIGIGIVAGFLFLVAVLGIIGTLRHNQIIMFFYMVLLGISGISLFSVSVVALSVPSDFQAEIFTKAWAGLSSDKKATIQDRLGCCGFNDVDKDVLECEEGHPLCNTTVLTAKGACCEEHHLFEETIEGNCTVQEPVQCPNCDPCYSLWRDSVSTGLKWAGGLGLIFSFTQVAGIVLTVRYRNLKDPNAKPGDFL